MQREKYSAGAVKLAFWFNEFRKTVASLRSGMTMHKIKELVEQDNFFSAATPGRSKQIFSTVSARVSAISDRYYGLFEDTVTETQKLVVLLSIMLTDTLFFAFMNEVFREKLITGDLVLTDADVRIFFLNKQRESEKVAGWTDETLIRLRNCYKTYLAEAGLLEKGVGDRKLIKPLPEDRFSALLSEDGLNPILGILTGTR